MVTNLKKCAAVGLAVTLQLGAIYALPITGINYGAGSAFLMEAYAADSPEILTSQDGFNYQLIDGEVYIVSYNNETNFLNIPETIDSKYVVGIKEGAFKDKTQIKYVNLPDSIKTIEKDAFSGCSSIEKLTMSESAEEIGDSAFAACISLTEVSLPDGLKTIGASAFSGCSAITSIEIPNSVTKIGSGAFDSCSALNEVIYNGTSSELTALFENSADLDNMTAKISTSDATLAEDPIDKNLILLEDEDGTIYGYGIDIGTNLSQLIKKIDTDNIVEISVLDKDADSVLMTGDILNVKYKVATQGNHKVGDIISINVVIAGDVNNDQKINVKDISAIQSHILGISSLSDDLVKVADVNRDSVINVKDMQGIQKMVLGI